MKIKLTDDELSRLGLLPSLPSLDEEQESTVYTDTFVTEVNTSDSSVDKTKYDNEYLSLAAINRSKNLLVTDMNKVAFTGAYADLSGTPKLATRTTDGFLSYVDKIKIDSLADNFNNKANIGHTHVFTDITDIPYASENHPGIMQEKHYRLLETGLAEVAKSGMYSDLSGKPELADEFNDGLLSKDLYKEINKIKDTFGSSFIQNSNGIFVYNHTHQISDIIGIEDVVERCNIDIDNIIRRTEGYSSVFAGYDNAGNYYKGLMRGEDKNKLDKIDPNANCYIHPETHPVTIIEGLAEVAKTGAYKDLAGAPDIIGTINNVDPQNGIGLGTTGGLQIRRNGLPKISFQRGVQYFHDSSVATKATLELDPETETDLKLSLTNDTSYKINNVTGNCIAVKPKITSFANCELEVTGNVVLKHLQDPEAAGYNGLVLGVDTNNSAGNEYGKHSMGIIGNHTIGFGNNLYGTEEYNAFINTRTGDLFLKGDLYIGGVIKNNNESIPSLASNDNVDTISSVARSLGIDIEEKNGAVTLTDTVLALLDKIEELNDTIERQEIRIRQMEKFIYE